jgi:hypothetical protein
MIQKLILNERPVSFQANLEVSLTIHKKRKHEKVKTEVCEMCGKSCFDKSDLKQHIATVHTTGREYVCDKCGSTYANLFSLRGKVSILGVEPLLPFFAWLFPGCKKTYLR